MFWDPLPLQHYSTCKQTHTHIYTYMYPYISKNIHTHLYLSININTTACTHMHTCIHLKPHAHKNIPFSKCDKIIAHFLALEQKLLNLVPAQILLTHFLSLVFSHVPAKLPLDKNIIFACMPPHSSKHDLAEIVPARLGQPLYS